METKKILYKLRTERGMSQDELADKIMVTRQAVSRWENGDTVPNTDTLKLLSKEFDVSINTLLGEPRKLICQCCGMPIDDDSILGRDKDGTLNEEYCKWCYADGTYTYNDMDELIDVCVKNMVNENFTEEQARSYVKEMLPKSLMIRKPTWGINWSLNSEETGASVFWQVWILFWYVPMRRMGKIQSC